MLGPLADNGGPTQTLALLPGSPAIDAGDDALCPSTDQRGEIRPQDGNNDGLAKCDIGAFELGPDVIPPSVLSVTRVDPNPSSATQVNFNVVFSEAVTGVDAPDFALATTGLTGASVTDVVGSAGTYTVMVNTGSGDGTLGLNVVVNGTIKDSAGNPLNAGYTDGEIYTIAREYTLTIVSANGTVTRQPDQATYHEGDVVQLTAFPNAGWGFVNWSGDLTGNANPASVTLHGNTLVTANYAQLQTLSLNSVGTYDGWVLESNENSNIGGSLNATSSTLNVGDDNANRQYMGFLHFDTSGLPDNAMIVSATLRILKQGLSGTDPFTTHGDLLVDIQKPYFGSTMALAAEDFQAASGAGAAAAFDPVPINKWYSAGMNSTGFAYVNLVGTTQFRLHFELDDNNERNADFIKFYSGNAATANRPQLIIQYYIP